MNPLRWWAGGVILALLVFIGLGCGTTDAPAELTVAAAASMQPVVETAVQELNKPGIYRVIPTFGATKQLAQQIAEGAPVDVFIAADTGSVGNLVANGHIRRGSAEVYAFGSVVLWLKDTTAQPGLAALDDARRQKIGIANPDLAPYGAAARAALLMTNRWLTLQPRLVFGENVGQVAAYAQRGEVDAAFLPRALALDRGLTVQAIPEAPRLAQALGIVQRSSHQEEARAFVAYLTGPEGRALLQAKGYDLP